MKKLFLILFFLLTANAFSQDADTSDYFRIGLYGGTYISSHEGVVERNMYFNSIGLEAEYVKLKYLSIYIRSFYEITELHNFDTHYQVFLNNPTTYRYMTSFGAKYYLREKNVKPYFQLAFNHEANYVGSYTLQNLSGNNILVYKTGYWSHYYSLYFGIGIDIKLYKNISTDIHYDIYRVFRNESSSFSGFSVLAGIKYNIVY